MDTALGVEHFCLRKLPFTRDLTWFDGAACSRVQRSATRMIVQVAVMVCRVP